MRQYGVSRGGPSGRVRPGQQGAQKGLQEVKEAAKLLSSKFRVEELLNTAVPEEFCPVGCSEGAGREDVMEGVQVGV